MAYGYKARTRKKLRGEIEWWWHRLCTLLDYPTRDPFWHRTHIETCRGVLLRLGHHYTHAPEGARRELTHRLPLDKAPTGGAGRGCVGDLFGGAA